MLNKHELNKLNPKREFLKTEKEQKHHVLYVDTGHMIEAQPITLNLFTDLTFVFILKV